MRFSQRQPDHTFVIGEFGSNHMGVLESALDAVRVAASAGCDAVKFQLFRLEDILVDPSQGDRSTEMPASWLPILHSECSEHDIEFMCTPFSSDAVRALDPYVETWKIGSFEHKRDDIWDAVKETNKPIISSSGILGQDPDDGLYQLYCVSKYPSTPEDICLLNLDVYAGFSDHTTSTVVPALAVARGAWIIEKHFRLSDTPTESPDYPHSLDPSQLSEMVRNIRLAEEVCRDKTPQPAPQYPNRRQ